MNLNKLSHQFRATPVAWRRRIQPTTHDMLRQQKKKNKQPSRFNKHPQLYKTEPCDSYQMYGECKHGDRCQFYHDKAEKREPPPAPLPSSYKSVRCREYWGSGGMCRYGKKCKFAHETAMVKTTPRPRNYQTKLCKTWEETETCPYGEHCNFIHRRKKSRLVTCWLPLPATTV